MSKHVFWIALILTAAVFFLGILFGFVLENSRSDKLERIYMQSELDLIDIKLQTQILSLEKINCTSAIRENINFANRIYEEALLFEDYEESARLSDELRIQHKKFDMLRTLFWVNSMQIKSKCNSDYHNIVYIYQYNTQRLDLKAKQTVFSRILGEIKSQLGDKVMLIPIAGDNNISSVKLLMDTYGVKESELPVILIDENIKISEIEDKSEILKYLN